MTQINAAEQRIQNIWLGYKGYSDKVYALLISVMAALWGVYLPDVPAEYDWHWWLTDVGIAPNVCLGIAAIFVVLWAITVFRLQRPSYAKLVRLHDQSTQSSNEKAEAIESALKSVMAQLAKNCKADSDNHRATVYFRHEGSFVAVARYSLNPVNGRITHELSEHQENLGVISEAWKASEAYCVDLPADRTEWEEKICAKYGYSPERASKFRMQSLSYAAIRIGNADGSVGVLVMESTTARGVNSATLKGMRGSLIQAALAEMITAHARHTPQIERLKKTASAQSNNLPVSRPWKKNQRDYAKAELVR